MLRPERGAFGEDPRAKGATVCRDGLARTMEERGTPTAVRDKTVPVAVSA